MAIRKEHEMLFKLNAELGSSYSSAFKDAQNAITSMQKEITTLSRVQADISAYQRQETALENNKNKLEVLQQQYDNIQREMEETGTFSSSLENKLLTKQQQIDRTTNSISNQEAKLSQMGNTLQEAGVNTDNLAGETARLGTEMEALKGKQVEAAESANSFGFNASDAFSAAGQALVAAGIVVGLKKIVDQFKQAVEASIEFETVMAGVERTVGGSKEEIAALGDEFKDLSTEIPITTSELAGIAETAGQLGVARELTYEFTETMAMLATTTDLTADNAATMLAQFANITGLTDYERLGSVVADLGDATATTASLVVQMSQGMAASASIAGFAETDILAVAAAVGSLGNEAQAGSTAMSTLISTLYKAVETGSEELTDFAQIANMTADEFAEAWGNDAVSAMNAFIQGLNDTERNGKSAIVILDELGITNVRQTKAILGLAQAGDLLSGTISQANRAWDENAALGEKASIMYDTTGSQLVMMENAYNNLRIAVGDNFTPELSKLYGIGTDVLKQLTEFVENNPQLVKAITAFGAVIGTAVIGLTGYVAIMKLAVPLTAAFSAVMPGLNVIGAVAGIAALAGAIAYFSDEVVSAEQEARELTATSREQYYEMENLKKEYDRVSSSMGETSVESQLLKKELDEATAAFEENKQTVKELEAAEKELFGVRRDSIENYNKTIEQIDKEYESNINLLHNLEEMVQIEDKTTQKKKEILAVVELLNEAVPGLGLAYNEYSDSLNMSADAIEKLVEAELSREKNAADYEELKKAKAANKELKDTYEKRAQETINAEKELTAALEAESAKRAELGAVGGEASGRAYAGAIQGYVEEVNRATKAVEESTEAEKIAQDEYDKNKNLIDELSNSLANYAVETGNVDGVTDNLVGRINDITDYMKDLSDAYEESYDAALASVGGQYDLWDKAAKVVAVSVEEMTKGIESQTKYWQDYNTNLEILTQKTEDIEGLADMIATFADGSEDSVNAIAGMAKANDKDLQAMVNNWQGLQKEQEMVSESIAELETDFTNSMNSIQSEAEQAIKEMNFSEEAAQAGINTIQGFIDGAEDMLPAVRSAYSRIANAATREMERALRIQSPSEIFEGIGEYTMMGFTSGVSSMEPDVSDTMLEVANTGTKAFTNEESSLMALMTSPTMARNEAVSAISGSSSSKVISPTFNIDYNITGSNASDTNELFSVLNEASEHLREFILDVLEDAEVDKQRRAFV